MRVSGSLLESFATDMCAQKKNTLLFSSPLQATVPTFVHMGEIWLKVGTGGEDGYWLQASRERAKCDIKATQGAGSSGADG